MVNSDRYATSDQQLKRAREQVKAASLVTIAFGGLLAVAVLGFSRVYEASSESILNYTGLLVMGVLFVALGLGIWQRRRWCAVVALLLLVVMIGYHILAMTLLGQPGGRLFFLVVPLVPAIANWVALPAMRELAREGGRGE
jgi:predicted RND superfamily exporter protein